MHEYCAQKFGKRIFYILFYIMMNNKTFAFFLYSIEEGKLQSNYWFDGPSKLQKFRKEIYAIKKYGIAPDDPLPKEDKAERQELDEFYKKVKRSEKLDDVIDSEIDKVKDLGNFTIAPKSKIEKLTPSIQRLPIMQQQPQPE